MHIFKYSRRKGTVADKLPGQLTDAQKTERSGQLLALEKEQSREFRAHYLGQEVEVLIEEQKEIGGKVYWLGHTDTYVKRLRLRRTVQNAWIIRTGWCTDERFLSCRTRFWKLH